MMELDWAELVRRVVKYLVLGLTLALSARFLLKQSKLEDVLALALTGAATFALLDTFAPSISSAARLGAGAQIGWRLMA